MASQAATSHSDPHQSSAQLVRSLSQILPKGHRFHVYHLTTPPTRTDALFSAPPDVRPDRTYCESHFLALSIDVPAKSEPGNKSPRSDYKEDATNKEVLVLALEILIFTTAYTTTFFVSKADSTGYLNLLDLPKGTPSPIREVTTAFISYLVRQRRRKGIQSIVSLFARAQGQYLFPGSVEYAGKHVLTDRGLVKWWCKVLNPLLDRPATAGRADGPWQSVKGYLIVPGLDAYETRAFIPRTAANSVNPEWVLGHPLERISHYTLEYDWVPPRCLIARYPDDPKSRFRDELDAEADEGKGRYGAWKSVHNLEQFWELMAFRQECSMGALTGFIWIVLDPYEANDHALPSSQTESAAATDSSSGSLLPVAAPSTPSRKQSHILPFRTPQTSQSSPLKSLRTPRSSDSTPAKKSTTNKKKKKVKLTGPIIPREPRVKTGQRNYLVDRPIATAYYYWPPEGRGRRLVKEDGYKRSIELLLRLDFANLDLAVGSTRRWINEVGLGASWGLDIIGSRAPPETLDVISDRQRPAVATVSSLSGLVKRKRSGDGSSEGDNGNRIILNGNAPTEIGGGTSKVNILGASLIRKKLKDANPEREASNGDGADANQKTDALAAGPPTVNILSGSIIRKKRKPGEEEAVKPISSSAETSVEVNGNKPSSDPPKVNVLGYGLVRKKPKV